MLEFASVSPFLNFIYDLGGYIYGFFMEVGLVAFSTFEDIIIGNNISFYNIFTQQTQEIHPFIINAINNTYSILDNLLPNALVLDLPVLIFLYSILGVLAIFFFALGIIKSIIK